VRFAAQNLALSGVRRVHLARLNYFLYYRTARRRVEALAVPLHHVRPLSRGGTNSFDNLVPFTQTTHQRYTKLLHNEPFPGEQYHVQGQH